MSFDVHPNFKNHTGTMISMVSRSIMELSWKQKINGRSSTEAGIVGAYDALPHCLWLRYFVEVHGYVMKYLEFHKDNMSAMLMEKNGKESSTKRTKHIQARYFFIKVHIKNRGLSLKY